MTDTVDLIVVGAGPAGMAAATSAADLGLSVIIVDQQAEPGGQIYRGLERLLKTNPKRAEALGEDYMQGAKLVRDFRASTAQFRANTMVWQVDVPRDVPRGEPQRDHVVFTTSPNGPRTIQGRHIVIATGAVERATAFPGWTLPGVMTCGAAQILLKSAAAVPQGRTVLAGSGPLLFLLAWQLLNAGLRVSAILETTSHRNYARTLLRSFGALRYQKYLRLGFSLLGDLRGAGIPIIGDVSDLSARGEHRVSEVSYLANKVRAQQQVDLLLVHEGIVPNLNLWLSLRAEMAWNATQRSFQVESGCGAVAVGSAYLFPPLSCGGASLAEPWLRFHTPLIEPDVRY